MAMTPVPAFPALSDRADGSYNSKAFAWASHMGGVFVPEANALIANLNSLAAGGAFSLPYVIQSSSVTVGGPAGGNFALTPDGTGLLIDTKSAQGVNVAGALLAATAAAGTVRGSVRIVKQNDPSVFLLYNIINSFSPDAGGLFGYFAVSYVAGNGTFGEGSSVMLFFQRAGEKGDMGSLPSMLIRDQKASGATAQSLSAGVWTKRTQNTTVQNSIPGASLSNDEAVLPIGTYLIHGTAPAAAGATHQVRLFNVTDNVLCDVGTSEGMGAGQTSVSRSLLQTVLVVAGAAKRYRIDHFANNTVAGGLPVSSGGSEVYTQTSITKIA
ncbi:hypothetical protein [Massilia sp. BHUDP2]|uniref:hypothetical protein n=1 Tax=Massilia sp. BHUDP2 TaxID=3034505 RepID=UPI003905F1DE